MFFLPLPNNYLGRFIVYQWLPRWLSGKESACQCRRCRRHGFNPWVGKILWVLSGNPLQYSCLGNPMDRGVWQALYHLIFIISFKLAIVSFICGEGNRNPLQYSCLENPMDGGAWYAAVHGFTKSRAWLSNFTFAFHFHALEKEMATHSNILAWRIPETEEPSGLSSMGLHTESDMTEAT